MVCLLYGQIKSAGSSRRGHSSCDKRVFCHEALHLSASYSQAIVEWDSDSDSGDSEDEDFTKLMQ